ncbi:MAG TPA: phosphatase PAP2 family protein [Beijerinckiaceae bacterium]|nr:phosphatase PAP2 family protein [Beijerinckiaceae bacterium]
MIVPARITRLDWMVRACIAAMAAFCFASPLLGGRPVVIQGEEFSLAVLALMVAIAVLYGPRRRNLPGFARLAGLVADIMAQGLVFGMASYVFAGMAGPLMDGRLAALDGAIGFDWLTTFRLVQSAPALEWALCIGYYSMMAQLGLWLLLLSWRGEHDRVRLLINAFAINAILAIVLSGLVPAMGAFPYFGVLAADGLQSTAPVPGIVSGPYRELMALRSGAMQEIVLVQTSGIVTFPSFHTMTGVVLAASVWHIGWLRLPALVLNALLIAATPPVGGHYLVDTLAGLVLAALVLILCRHYVMTPLPAPAAAPAMAAQT